jgi:hypothetical protein
MADKPWWRDARQLPPTRTNGGPLDAPTPTMMVGFGIVLVCLGILGLFAADSLPGVLVAAGGSAIGVGIGMRWNRRRAPSVNQS